jgi:hypothetical protein
LTTEFTECYIRRYQEYTGQQAVLEGEGRTFEGVARERAEAPNKKKSRRSGTSAAERN